MALNVAKEIAALKSMTVGQLRVRYEEVFGEATQTGNKDWLWKRIAWRMQANAEGDLSERARRRAEFACDADIRRTLEICAFDHDAAATYGDIRADLERAGTPIGPFDTLIAAHAVALKAAVVTNNEREFRRVCGLRVENWTKG